MRKQGEVQYFIGVQLDGSAHVDPLQNSIPEYTAKESEQLVWALFTSIIYHSFIINFVISLCEGISYFSHLTQLFKNHFN